MAIPQSPADQLSRILGPAFHAGVEASRNNTMLMAALDGNTPVIELLLEMGGSIEVKNKFGMTPLMLAILSGSYPAIDMLLKAGADLNTRDNFQNTPLMYAVKMSDWMLIYKLRCIGVQVDAYNEAGETALICAVRENKLLAVQALLDPSIEGRVAANPVATNCGMAPVFMAMEARAQIGLTSDSAGNSWQNTPMANGRGEMLRKNSTIIAALLGAGVDVNVTDNEGNTLQTYAVMMHDIELITMLRNTGANPQLRNLNDESAMTYALASGLPSLLNLLQHR